MSNPQTVSKCLLKPTIWMAVSLVPGIQNNHTSQSPTSPELTYVPSGETGSKHFAKAEKAVSQK